MRGGTLRGVSLCEADVHWLGKTKGVGGMFFESELSNARIIKYRGMQVTYLRSGGVGVCYAVTFNEKVL